MRLTRRGVAVLCVCAGGFLFSFAGGPRALNAVVLPGIVGVGAAVAQLSLLSPPTLDREAPADGFAGERRTVELVFRSPDGARGRPFVGTVRETVGEGLVADRTEFEATVGGEPIRYEVEYAARGERTFGPATVTARDVFGLAETEFEYGDTERVLVYPRIRPLASGPLDRFGDARDAAFIAERGEFDRLRGYVRGDPLRDIHWRSTAKRDELVVKEFDADAETVTVAAGAGAGAADAMAEAVASVAFALIDEGVPVGVALPNGSVEVGPERGGRTRLLELLARAGVGRVPDTEADVVVEADADGATVRVGGRETPFTALVGQGDPPAAATADSGGASA